MSPVKLAPVLTPHGHLSLIQDDDAVALDAEVAECLQAASVRGAGHGLLQLGASEVGTALPAVFSYWREFAARYVTALCTHSSLSPDAQDTKPAEIIAPPPTAGLEWLVMAAPLMTGAEYLTGALLRALWQQTDKALRLELSEEQCRVQEFLKRRNPAWNLVGCVCFNLAENRGDTESPFAFLATYTVRLSAHSKAQHLPLGEALREYEGAANRDRLLALLLPVQRAAEICPWLKSMVDDGEIFHPLRWTPGETSQFLRDCPLLEQAGIVVRMPATWPSHRPPRPRVTARVGGVAPSLVGQDALLDFHMDVTLDGESLTAAEIRTLLAGTEGLALVRGRWVEVDRDQLSRMIDRFSQAERAAASHGLNFGEAMRMVAGANLDGADADAESAEIDWAQVIAGPWLAETLKGLHSAGMAVLRRKVLNRDVRQIETTPWAMEMKSVSIEEPDRVVQTLTGAILGCGGWLLGRGASHSGVVNMRFEFERQNSADIYCALIGSGLELSEVGHASLTALCECTNRRPKSCGKEVACIELEIQTFPCRR